MSPFLLFTRSFEEDQQTDENQDGRPEKMPPQIPESPVILVKERNIAKEKMNPEGDHYNAEDQATGFADTLRSLREGYRTARAGLLRFPRFNGRFRNDDHPYDIGYEGGAADEQKDNGNNPNQHGIHVEVLTEAATDAVDDAILSTFVESLHIFSNPFS